MGPEPGMHKVEIIGFFFLIALFRMAHFLLSPTPYWPPPLSFIGCFEMVWLLYSVSGLHSLPGVDRLSDVSIYLGNGGLF